MNGNSENSLFAFFFSVISPVCRTNFFLSLTLSLSLSPFLPLIFMMKKMSVLSHTQLCWKKIIKENNMVFVLVSEKAKSTLANILLFNFFHLLTAAFVTLVNISRQIVVSKYFSYVALLIVPNPYLSHSKYNMTLLVICSHLL